MNSRIFISLVLLFLVTGCLESTTPTEAESNVVDSATGGTPEREFRGRERSAVKLTDAAVAKFKEFLAAEPTKHIRLSVKQEGPTGFMYDLQIDDSIDEADFVDTSHGFTVVVDAKSSIFLEGATIDWLTQPDGQAGFKFDNPNAMEQ